jgi:hypothetical protein
MYVSKPKHVDPIECATKVELQGAKTTAIPTLDLYTTRTPGGLD